MTIPREHLLAAGQVLTSSPTNGEVVSISVDGHSLSPSECAQARTAASAGQLPTAPVSSGRIERALDKIESKFDALNTKLNKYALGRTVAKLLQADPERVSSRSIVTAHLADGRTLTIPVEVLDRRATSFLQRVSTIAELAILVPFVGLAVPFATSLAAGLASLATRMGGHKALANALGKTALKQFLLGAVCFIPVVDKLIASLAVIVDRRDLRALHTAPSVAAVVNLRPAKTPRAQ